MVIRLPSAHDADHAAPGPMGPPPAARRAPGLRRRRALVLLTAAILVWTVGALAAQYTRTYTLARQAAQLDQRRRDLATENQALRDEIQRLRTDDAYIERLARTELGLVRPGEVEFLVVPPKGTSPQPDPGAAGRAAAPAPAVHPSQASPADGGWFSRLLARVSSLLSRLHP